MPGRDLDCSRWRSPSSDLAHGQEQDLPGFLALHPATLRRSTTPDDPWRLAIGGATGAACRLTTMKASSLQLSRLKATLHRPLSTLHDERRRSPCETRFQLAGCAFAGRESNPLGSVERFQIKSSSFPGRRLAQGQFWTPITPLVGHYCTRVNTHDLPRSVERQSKPREWKKLDRKIPADYSDLNRFDGGLKAGELFVITGRPSTDKTTLTLNIALSAAVSRNRPTSIFCLYLSSEHIVLRLIAVMGRFAPCGVLKRWCTAKDWDRIDMAAKYSRTPPFSLTTQPTCQQPDCVGACWTTKRKWTRACDRG